LVGRLCNGICADGSTNRKKKHPVDCKKYSSVSIDEVFIHDCPYGVPEDYIYHQMLSLRSSIAEKDKYYRADRNRFYLSGNTLILIDDVLKSSDTIVACLRSIKKNVLKINYCCSVPSDDANKMLRLEADQVVYLRAEHSFLVVKKILQSFQ
jgi:predicted phosphoribosyltransferase